MGGTRTAPPGTEISCTPKNSPVGLTLLTISRRPVFSNFPFHENRRYSGSRLKDTRSPTSNQSQRVMPRSDRSSKLAGIISHARSNALQTLISLDGAKAKRSSLAIRGLAIGDATHLSRYAACVSQPAD